MNSAALAGKPLAPWAPSQAGARRASRPSAARGAPAVKAILGLERMFKQKAAVKPGAPLFGGKTGEALATEVKETEAKYILQTYKRTEQVFVSGRGSYLIDASGKEFLDFSGGIAVNVFGHSDPEWARVVSESAGVLAHTSNLYHTVPGPALAKLLVENSFADRVFFCNSGTEANEAAIKFARKFQQQRFEAEKAKGGAAAAAGPATDFLCFTNCFHGRTMGALALTYKDGYRTPFQPVMPGAETFVDYNDLEAAKKHIVKGRTAAVFVEPVQGEGGIYVASKEFLQGLRRACDDAGALLVYDEVQCGLGRTGKLWGYMNAGVEPDIMTAAKPLAGGLPIGAVLMREKVAAAMQPGDHGSTFAGGPLIASVALHCVERVMQKEFLQNVLARGDQLRSKLQEQLKGNANLVEVRGTGLLVGIQMKAPVTPIVEARHRRNTEARKRGLLVITAGAGDIVRMVPPLTITAEEVDKCAEILAGVINDVMK